MSEEFEMPTPCQKCEEIFDLTDGCGSTKWFPDIVICQSCGKEEEKEIEQDEEMRDFCEQVENADWEIKDCIKTFKSFSDKNTSIEFQEYYDKAKNILDTYSAIEPNK